MKKYFVLTMLFCFSINAQIKYPFKSYKEFKTKLDSVCSIANDTDRAWAIAAFFDTLRSNKRVPFAFKDTVALTYRGEASSVAWAGDFNGWNPNTGNFKGTKIGLSNVWLCEKTFPVNSRLDYKIVVGSNWITDPENSFVQYSGVGSTNSELRMPGWIYPVETIKNPNAAAGKLSENFSLNSSNLGYTVYFKVYTPSGYESLNNLSTIYVTDGHEYADDRLGSMITVLDNLIAQKKINPIVTVFVDPRSAPNSSSTNRRGSEYITNKKFADFVADELTNYIDNNFKTNKSAETRAILGTSLGGLNSAYFGAVRNDKFRLIGIHSPAFQVATQIYDLYKQADKLPLKIFMSTGTIYDTQSNALQLKTILDSKSYLYKYIEVPEGHSWGNWRALIDEPLIYFFPYQSSSNIKKDQPLPTKNKLGSYPNPFNSSTKIWFDLSEPATVTLDVYDSVGAKITRLISNQKYSAGNHEVNYSFNGLSTGVYFCQLTFNSGALTNRLLYLK